MPLTGDLKTFQLANVLQLLCIEKKTGLLKVTSNNSLINVYLEDGTITHAMESQKESRMGYLLKSQGIISAEELDECLELSKKKKKPIGKILVEQKHISEEKLREMSKCHIEEILYNMFLWKTGDFNYKDCAPEFPDKIDFELNTMELVLEAARRVDELTAVTEEIPEDEVTYKISDKVQDKEEIKLNAKQWRILSLINSDRNVRNLINETGYDEFAVYAALHYLSTSKLIEKAVTDIPKQKEEKKEPAKKKGRIQKKPAGPRPDGKKTILVVDDKSQIRSVLRFSLRDIGYNTMLAANGKDALTLIDNEGAPDLIIMDLDLPKMTGLELIKKIRRSETTTDVPIILLTTDTNKEDILKGVDIGANDFVLKPFKFADLNKKIEKHL